MDDKLKDHDDDEHHKRMPELPSENNARHLAQPPELPSYEPPWPQSKLKPSAYS